MGEALQDPGEELERNLEALRDRSGAHTARLSSTREILQREQRVIGLLRVRTHGRKLRPIKSILALGHPRCELERCKPNNTGQLRFQLGVSFWRWRSREAAHRRRARERMSTSPVR